MRVSPDLALKARRERLEPIETMGDFMLRNILAGIAGVIAGGLAVFALETLGHIIFPLPEGVEIDPMDMESVRAAASQIPAINKLAVVIAWFGGAVVAGWVASLVTQSGKLLVPLICGGILMLAGLANLISIPSPIWMWVLGLAAFLPGAWLGARLPPNH